MKNKFNLIIMAFISFIFFTGCNKSSNSNEAVNGSNVVITANRATPPSATFGPQIDSNLNVVKFNKLETGMKYADVVKMLGSEGEVISDSDMSGVKTTIYKWSGASGAFVKAIFQNGKLIDKVHTGLR